MKEIEQAKLFDSQDRPIEAIHYYEQAMKEKKADVNDYLDLAIIYFNCSDFGYWSYHHLPDELMAISFERANALLDEAEQRFGKHSEVDFWRKYFAFVRLGAEPFIEECQRLAETGNSLVPYFYLFAYGKKKEQVNEIRGLWKWVQDESTSRKRLIKSILEAYFNKKHHLYWKELETR